MMQTVPPKQARQEEKELDDFLISLDFNTKYNFVKIVKALRIQGGCEHEFKIFASTGKICKHCQIHPEKLQPKRKVIIKTVSKTTFSKNGGKETVWFDNDGNIKYKVKES